MTEIFSLNGFRAAYKFILDGYRDNLRVILKAKADRINDIERKVTRMTERELKFVQEEQRLIQLLNDLFHLQEEAMESLFQKFGSLDKQYLAGAHKGAELLEAIEIQKQFIAIQQEQINSLFLILKNRQAA